jgi:hypothetical protein
MYYNFCRTHQTLTKRAGGVHRTPAMEAGLTKRVWKVEDILTLMDACEPSSKSHDLVTRRSNC